MTNKCKLALGSDHGGWELKEHLKGLLAGWGYEFLDLGCYSSASVDYPDLGVKVVEAVLQGQAAGGILVCGTGIGMSIVANRYPGIRAALCHNELTARMSREHNDANILVLGGRVVDKELAEKITKAWLETEFAGERHLRRLEKINKITTTA